MKKNIFTFTIFVILNTILVGLSYGQTPQEKITKTVDKLFDAMRNVDSISAQTIFVKGATLSSIYINKDGQVQKKSTNISDFITTIGTPREEVWDEQLWSYDIKIDYPMAIAWTDYTFYVGGKMSHCGVNVFELINVNNIWVISSITDTRRSLGCKTKSLSEVNELMAGWHQAAAVADEDLFFGSMTTDGIYIGTDISERWTNSEMRVWAQKYFDREVAWAFEPKNRNITFNSEENIGWFDEELETWMGDCRGSGVVVKTAAGWKIKQYHLSIAVPNDKVDSYLKIIDKSRIKRGE